MNSIWIGTRWRIFQRLAKKIHRWKLQSEGARISFRINGLREFISVSKISEKSEGLKKDPSPWSNPHLYCRYTRRVFRGGDGGVDFFYTIFGTSFFHADDCIPREVKMEMDESVCQAGSYRAATREENLMEILLAVRIMIEGERVESSMASISLRRGLFWKKSWKTRSLRLPTQLSSLFVQFQGEPCKLRPAGDAPQLPGIWINALSRALIASPILGSISRSRLSENYRKRKDTIKSLERNKKKKSAGEKVNKKAHALSPVAFYPSTSSSPN